MTKILDHIYLFVFFLAPALPAVLQAQGAPAERPLGVEEAVARALEGNGDLAAAGFRTEAARAGARQASAFLYPMVGVDVGATRTDDPVGVFGTKLRQERFGEADFAIDALNRPDAVSDWTAGGGATWRIADPSAWAAREAARLTAVAADLGLDRHREAVAFRTRVLYLEALAARADAAAADTAAAAARATLEMVRNRREQGFLTDADVLQAEAEVEAARARSTDARRRSRDARAALGVHVGMPADTVPRLTAGLLERTPETGGTGPADPGDRADLRALERTVRAADARAAEAARARFPALEAFGRLSSHAPELTGDRTANWSAGVQLSWPLFTGFAREGGIDRARAERRALEAEYDQRLREARAELREARRALDAARAGAEAAEAAARAAGEARRLMRRRFQEGMATTVDLLQADARAAGMESRAIDARARLQMAAARLDFVRGATLTDDTNDEDR